MGKYLTLTVLSCILLSAVTATNYKAQAYWETRGISAERISEIAMKNHYQSD
jgi:hypothetical protein